MSDPSHSLRILVADDECDVRDCYAGCLRSLQHEVWCTACNGRELVELCEAHHPDLIITDVGIDELDDLRALGGVCRDHCIPIILVGGHHEPELLEEALAHPVLAYLIKPINPIDLEITLALAARRFEELRALRDETASLRRELEERKLIERAKGTLMSLSHCDESEALCRLRKMARDNNLKLADVARSFLDTAELFRPTPVKLHGNDTARTSSDALPLGSAK